MSGQSQSFVHVQQICPETVLCLSDCYLELCALDSPVSDCYLELCALDNPVSDCYLELCALDSPVSDCYLELCALDSPVSDCYLELCALDSPVSDCYLELCALDSPVSDCYLELCALIVWWSVFLVDYVGYDMEQEMFRTTYIHTFKFKKKFFVLFQSFRAPFSLG